MMPFPEQTLRERSLPLPAAADAAARQRLEESLRQLESVEYVQVDGQECRIRYRFPALGFAMIWARAQETMSVAYPLATRIRCGLTAVMEDNERDHVTRPCGWYRCVAAIHARRFDPSHGGSGDVRRQQWQQYTGRRRGTTR